MLSVDATHILIAYMFDLPVFLMAPISVYPEMFFVYCIVSHAFKFIVIIWVSMLAIF